MMSRGLGSGVLTIPRDRILYLMTGIVGVVQKTKVATVVTFPVWGVCAGVGVASAVAGAAAVAAVGFLFYGLCWVLARIGKAAWHFLEPVWRLILKPILKGVGVFLWPILFRPLLHLIALPFWTSWWIVSNIAPTFRYLSSRRLKRKAHDQSINTSRDNGQAEPGTVATPALAGGILDNMLLRSGLSMELLTIGRDATSLAATTQPTPSVDEKHMYSVKPTQPEPWLEAMMLVTCQRGSKSPCWACGVQICEGCVQTAQCEAPRTAQHFELCAPQCSRCYFQGECRKPRLRPENTCALHRRSYSGRQGTGVVADVEVRRVCPLCAALTPQRLREAREALEVEELRHLSQSDLKCKSCSRKVANNGPRWWACSCGMECKSEYHPAWGSIQE